MKKVIFRLEYGENIGLGHLVRCQVLAKKFKFNGYKCLLLTTSKKKNTELKKIFYKIIILPKKNNINHLIKNYYYYRCDYLVVDLLKFKILDQKKLIEKKIRWFQFINSKKSKCLADQYTCSLPYKEVEYKKDLKDKVFIGKEFSILRPQFYNKKKINIKKKIFICFGGGNDKGSILFVLKSIHKKIKNYKINLLIGNNPNLSNIKKWIEENRLKKKINLIEKAKHIVNFIDESQFAICSGGTISHEIDSRSKKMIILSIAKNQDLQSKLWTKFGNYYVGNFNQKNKKIIYKKILRSLRKIMPIKNKKFYLKKNSFLEKIIINANR